MSEITVENPIENILPAADVSSDIISLKKEIAGKCVDALKWKLFIGKWDKIKDYLVSEDIGDRISDNLTWKLLWTGLGLFDSTISSQLESLKAEFDAANTTEALHTLETKITSGEIFALPTTETPITTPVVAPIVAPVIIPDAPQNTPEKISDSWFVHPLPWCILSSPFWPRWGTQHKWVDFWAPMWKDILSSTDWEVFKVGNDAKWYWNYIIIKTWDWKQVLYWHMKEPSKLTVWEKVKKWETVLWFVGSTWHSTWPHLHFEVRNGDSSSWLDNDPIDPLTVLEITKNDVDPSVLSRIEPSLLKTNIDDVKKAA